MLGSTYRYQILLTTSVNGQEAGGPVVTGVLGAMSWMITQLLPAFDQQAATILDTDLKAVDTRLAELKGKLAEADSHEEHWKTNREDLAKRQGPARLLLLQLWDQLIGKTPAKLKENITFNAEQLGATLEDICKSAQVDGYSKEEVAPFAERRAAAKRAIEGLGSLRTHIATLRQAFPATQVAAAQEGAEA